MEKSLSAVARIWNLVRQEKTEITAIYFYAILAGLIQLSLPVGVQAIISFVLGGVMSTSLILLITLFQRTISATIGLKIGGSRVASKKGSLAKVVLFY